MKKLLFLTILLSSFTFGQHTEEQASFFAVAEMGMEDVSVPLTTLKKYLNSKGFESCEIEKGELSCIEIKVKENFSVSINRDNATLIITDSFYDSLVDRFTKEHLALDDYYMGTYAFKGKNGLIYVLNDGETKSLFITRKK